MINPLKSVEINRFRFSHPAVLPAHQGLSIAQISDIHLGRWVKPRHLRQVVDFVNAHTPDLVALTGDYVGYNRRDLPPAIEVLGSLAPPAFAVLGNHDHWTCPVTASEQFARVEIPLLTNSSVIVDALGAPLRVVGVDDHITNNADIDAAFADVDCDAFCLVLNHVPSLAERIAARGADLILSGHTHGHQFNIPGITHRIAKTLGVKYHVGAYPLLDDSYLYINRGLGSASWPLRIGAPPELTFFELAYSPRPTLELLESDHLNVKHR